MLMRREKQRHVIMQCYSFIVQHQKTVGFPEKEKFEEIRLEGRILSQYSTNLTTMSGIDIEIHATLRLVERDVDKSFWIEIFLFHDFSKLFHTQR